MVSIFIFSYGQLDLAFLTFKKPEEVIQQTELITTKVVEIFEYGKSNDRY